LSDSKNPDEIPTGSVVTQLPNRGAVG